MSRPTPHPKSKVYRIRKVIPAGLKDAAARLFGVKQEFIISLGTKNAAEARRLAPAALAEIERQLDACRVSGETPKPLNHMQCVALAGHWRAEKLENVGEPGSATGWEAEKDRLLMGQSFDLDGTTYEYEPSPKDIAEAAAVAAERGFNPDAPSLRMLAQSLWLAKVQFAETMMRRASGDYGGDEYADRYPDLNAANATAVARPVNAAGDGPSFQDLIRGFSRDKGIDPDARPMSEDYDRRSRFARHLTTFLGHDRAAAVTAEDAVRWKEHLQDSGKGPGTIANHLGSMSAVWRWGETYKKVKANPFAGLVKVPKRGKGKRKTPIRPYTDAEATMILKAAREDKRPTIRWTPWLLALTGARLAEVVQARKEDIEFHDGIAVLKIHEDMQAADEIRSVKNDPSIRNIPLHPDLIAEGFLDYVTGLPKGSPLFPDSKPDARYGNRAKTASKKVSQWMRNKLKIEDRSLHPNHSWRHWFIDAWREEGLSDELRHAITGHADEDNASSGYGAGYRTKWKQLHEAVSKVKLPPLLG